MMIKEKIVVLKELEECKVVFFIIKYILIKNEFSKVFFIG